MHKWMWLLIFLAFLGVGFSALDPDYGWHVAMGKYILEKGIPKTDPFSYTMPSYPFVDHEWLLNILMHLGEVSVGKNGLAAIFALIATGALFLIPRKKGWELGVVLAVGVLVFRGGVRPQVLDWLLVSVLWRIWLSKYKWWLPVIFLLWVNLHGGFAIGILMWLFMLVVKSIEDRGLKVDDCINWLLSFAATFINPYGWRIWWEMWMQITDHQLRVNINEWQPFFATVEPAFWFLAILFVMLAWRRYREKRMVGWKTLTVTVTLLVGVSSLRHIAIFAVVAAIWLPEQLEVLWSNLKKAEIQLRAKKVYWLFLTIAGIISVMALTITMANYLKGTWRYPEGAISYLKTRNFEGNLFSEYGWGGYLIWKYPEKKVFIDGRMPSWRWRAPLGESDNAMEDYVKIVKDADFFAIFDRFDVSMILIPKKSAGKQMDVFYEKIFGWLEKSLGWDNKENGSVLDKLKKDGWVMVYEDDTAQIYEKKHN